MDAVTLDWVATAYLLESTVFLVPFGRMAEKTKNAPRDSCYR